MLNEGERSPAKPADLSAEMLVLVLWQARRGIAIGLILGAALGCIVAFAIRPVYRAEVVAVPARYGADMGLSQSVGQLSGLAALVGLDAQRGDNASEYLEFLKSRTLTEHFISEHDLLPVLYAAQWDEKRKSWKNSDHIPTMAAAVRLFNKRVRSVSEDRRTSVVTLTMDWGDRQRAAQWANDYVALANLELGHRAIADAQATLTYLNNELPRASSIGVQQALYHLIEEQQTVIALASTRQEFAFKVIDQATAADPKQYESPNRPLIIFASTVAGALFGVGLSRLAATFRRRQASGRAAILG